MAGPTQAPDQHVTADHPYAGGTALGRCAACDVHSFGERHWGRAPLLSRAVDLPAGFDDLFGAAAVDELVSERGLRTPFLRMANKGTVLPAGRYTRGGGAGAGIADQAADDSILARLDEGSTLVLQALHRTWPPLVRFGSRLSAELGHPVQINAYVTPADNRGFAAHYDVHDVFVLQIAGRKRWIIHEPVHVDPLPDHGWEQRRDAVAARATNDEPVIDTVLTPGDALYLPRGTIHSAEALGETSIHLTVGVHPVTRFDVVRAVLAAAERRADLRSSLPMGADLTDPSVLAPHVASVAEILRDVLCEPPVGAVAGAIGDDLMKRTRPEPLGPLAQLAAAESLTLDSVLRRRAGLRMRVAETADAVTLSLLDRTVTVPAECSEAIKVVLDDHPFTPVDLPALSDDERLEFARRLLREGVLVAL